MAAFPKRHPSNSLDVCGGELAQIGKRLVMLGEGMMEGEGKKKKKNVGKIIKKTARKVAGKKNLKQQKKT